MNPQWQYNHLVIPPLISIIFAIILIIVAFRQRNSSLVTVFILFMFCTLIWFTASLLELMTLNFSLSLVFADISFLGITFFPILWLAIVMIYIGKEAIFRRLLPFVIIFPILTNIVIWTNPLHNLWRMNSTRDLTTTWFPITDYDYGIWFYTAHLTYSLIITFSANVLLIQSIFFRKNIYRVHIFTLLFVLNLPLLIEILHRAGFDPIANYNASILVFPISGLLLAWVVLNLGFLDLTPIARDLVVESMDDLMIVLDDQNRVRDLNPAARRMIFTNSETIIGQNINHLLITQDDLIQYITGSYSPRNEVVVKLEHKEDRFYELLISDISYPSGGNAGRLLMMRDITIRKQTEQAYADQLRQVTILEERQRLARELHDSVTQTLFAAGTLADLLPMAIEKKPERVKRYASEINQLINGTSAQLRLVLLELYPNALFNTDLGVIIKHVCQAYTGTTGTPVNFVATPKISLDNNAQLVFYRIAQESLHNINKHTQATEVTVNLIKAGDGIQLTVQDNGNGFDMEQVPANHFGLRNMRERAKSIDATLVIESNINIGTTISLSKGLS